MISKHSKTWTVYEKGVNNSYGQAQAGPQKLTAVITIVPFVPSKEQTDVRFVNSTHFGLTKELNISGGDRISDGVISYIVEYEVSETRLHQLYLRKLV